MTRRREFLFASAAAGLLSGLGAGSALARRRGRATPTGIAESTWKALLDQRFYLYDPTQGQVVLTLLAVRDVPPASPRQFVVTFSAAEHGQVVAGTYSVEHPQLGLFALFLQPAGSDSRGQLYRSEFSLLG
jgi:hypothetical protein